MDKTPIIFLAFANDLQDSDQYLRNLPKELETIRSILRPLEKNGICELVVRSNVTLKQIVDVFQDDSYRDRIAIFHYGGHAGSYQLLLENLDGTSSKIKSEGFNHFLATSQALKLVFLNACSTEAQAKELITLGVPLVIGTSQAIKDEIAFQLATSFYVGLAKGIHIGKAWEDAQAQITAVAGSGSDRDMVSYLRDKNEATGQIPWNLHIRPGSAPALQENLPGIANNPLFGLPQIPESYYLKLPPSPFVNIQHFQKGDAAIFFGRGHEIRNLYLRIKSIYPIILFYGQSGVGKSSLLEAGLLPRLENDYDVVYIRRDPRLSLLGTFSKQLNALSSQAEQSLLEQWLQIEKVSGKPFVLILDQVEEAFTQEGNEDPQKELSALLAELASIFDLSQQKPQGKVILSYRKEYLPEVKKQVENYALPYTELYLERLSRHGIIEAISGIASNPLTQDKYQISIQNDANGNLPVVIADDLLEDQTGALAPILQILLSRMWEESNDKLFSLDLYQKLKKDGILLQDFFDRQLKKLENWKAEVVDSGLVLNILNEHTTALGTSAAVPLPDLSQKYSHQSKPLTQIIQRCKDLYLLSQINQNETSLSHDTLAPIVQKAHKNSDKPGQRALRILESKSLDGQIEKGSILEARDLKMVEEGLPGMRAWNESERLLIEESQQVRSKREKQRKRIRFFASIAIIAILCFGFIATLFWQKSVQNAKEALALYLVATSKEQYEVNPTRALRLAEAAYAQNSSKPQAPVSFQLTQVFNNAIYQKKKFPKTRFHHEDVVDGALFSKDGQSVLTYSWDNTAKLWDLEGTLLAEMKHKDWITGALFSKDGYNILTYSEDSTAKLWNLEGALLAEMKHDSGVEEALFSVDGQSILTYPMDGAVKLWDLKGSLLADLERTSMVEKALFSEDNQNILTYSVDGMARLWDLKGTLLAEMEHASMVKEALFSEDGQRILTCSVDGTAKLWDLKGSILAEMEHKSIVYGALFSKDGQSILTYSVDSTAKLWDLKGSLLADMKHEDRVNKALFSKNGQSILTYSWDKTAKLWDLKGSLLAEMKHEDKVSGALFSADGQSVLSYSEDGAAKLWDLKGALLAEMKHKDKVSGALFSKNGQSILTYSEDGAAKLWDTQGALLADMRHENRINGALFSEDGQYILTYSWDGNAKLWDLEEMPLADMKHNYKINRALFSQDEQSILTYSWLGTTVKLWDFKGALLADLMHEENVSGALFSEDGQRILTYSRDSTAKLWDFQGTLLTEMKHKEKVNGAIFFQDDQSILTYSSDGIAKLWDLKGALLADMKHKDWIAGALFSEDGQNILTYSSDGTAKLWDLNGSLLANMQHGFVVSGALFSADGQSILTYSRDSMAKLWNLKGALLAEMEHRAIKGALFSEDDQSILTYSSDGTAKLWDFEGALLANMKHEDSVFGTQFSEDGKSILTYSKDGTAKLWDCKGTLLAGMIHDDDVKGALFSEDGRNILTYSVDGTAKLWDLKGALLADMKHQDSVFGTRFSEDGKSILTHSKDGTAKLWDLKGELLADMRHESTVNGALFSEDGNTILTYSADGTAKLWFTPPALFEWLKTAPIPQLTEEEKKMYNIPSSYR